MSLFAVWPHGTSDAPQAIAASPPEAAVPLTPGDTHDATLTAGAHHRYEFTIPSGSFAELVVEQGAADLLASHHPPAGTSSTIDGRWHGPEPVVIVTAAAGGVHRLDVGAAGTVPAALRYRIAFRTLRDSASGDAARVEAIRQSTAIKSAILKPTRESLLDAQTRLESLVTQWQTQGDRFGEAQSLHTLGFIANAFGRNQEAMTLYTRALGIWRTVRHVPGELQTLSNMGHVQTQLGELSAAARTYQDVIAMRRTIGDARGVALALNNLAVTYTNAGELEQALTHLDEALTLWRQLADRDMEGVVLANAAATAIGLGQLGQARLRYDEAIPLLRNQDPRRLASALSNLGHLHRLLGEYDAASARYEEARSLGEAAGDPRVQAQALMGAGAVAEAQRDWPRAAQTFRAALTLWQRAGDRRGTAQAEARLGDVAVTTGRLDEASELHQRALAAVREIGDIRSEAAILHGGARGAIARRDTIAARRDLDRALGLSRRVGDRSLEADILHSLARSWLADNDAAQALLAIESAVTLIESLRHDVLSPDQRITFFASAEEYIDTLVGVLMTLHRRAPTEGHDARAFEAAERGRARSLRDLLSEARAEIHEGIDPALARQERSLRRLIDAKAERHAVVASDSALHAQSQSLARDLDQLREQHRTLQARIRSTNPRYAALVQPAPIEVATVQQALDSDTALVAFALGAERSVAWLVTRERISSMELPAAVTIEAAARVAYAELSPQDDVSVTRKTPADSSPAASTLSDLLLGILSSIEVRRLIVIPDGALHYVPFAALPHPRPPRRPLVMDYEIVVLPSASLLDPAVVGHAHSAQAPATRVAVIADPVFSTLDSRVKRGSRMSANPTQPIPPSDDLPGVTRSAAEVGVVPDTSLNLPRLPFSRREATAIASIAGPKSTLVALDFAANRALAAGAILREYNIVHFATHGLLNTARPELSGLVLSLVDERGQPQPGFLRLHDIYNLRLDADLVVLSACHSALGGAFRGEGLVGLTRGFMYAGARQVVASLWKVDDEATAALMREFYRALLKERQVPAAALRTAQLALRRSPRWGAPRYWAAFVLQGQRRDGAAAR